MSNPTTATWTDPTTNTDGSAIVAGEITGFNLGFRLTTVSGSAAGTYSTVVPVSGATAASELLSAISPVLAPGSYACAVETVGPVSSGWSSEFAFTIVTPTPGVPTGLTVK